MEDRTPKPMTPFDELLTPPNLQMLKLFLPYTPSSNQQFLGIFIKFMELEHTISFFKNSRTALHNQTLQDGKPPSLSHMFQELKPYLPPKQSEMVDTFLNMMNIMEMATSFEENTQGQTGDVTEGLNPLDMMMGMLTPEQQNMFQMYNSMFSDDISSSENHPDGNTSNKDTSGKKAYDKGCETNEDVLEKNSNNCHPLKEKPGQNNALDLAVTIKGDQTHERMDEPPSNERY